MNGRAETTFNLKGILFLIILIFTSSCVYNGSMFSQSRVFYTPEEIKTDNTERDVNFTIRPNYWFGSPKNIRKYALPVYISVQNGTDKPIIIQREDIILLDDARNQYNALSPDDVANILLSSERSGYARIYPSISIGIGGGYYNQGYYYHGYHHRPYYWNSWFYDYPFYDYPRAYYRPDYKDIYTEALQPGKIMPDAKLSGFVYFKKLPDITEEIILQISYSSEETNETHSLDFHFNVLWEN